MSYGKFVYAVGVAVFDVDKGNCLECVYPKKAVFSSSSELVASLCLPDGAHIHKKDITYMFLNHLDDGTDKYMGESPCLYGMAVFCNVPDKTVKRGAIQKSMLVVMRAPFFLTLEPIISDTVQRYVEKRETSTKSLKVLFEALNENMRRNLTVTLWTKTYNLNPPVLKEDRFEGASLSALVRKFSEDVMLIWYGLLLEKRVLFSGQPASDVANCCLAAPLLVAPLTGFREIISPYVCLTDLSKIEQRTFICGSTNMLFETRQEWWDVLGSFQTGAVVSNVPEIKISTADKELIRNVLIGLEDNRGESWCRDQFRHHTLTFLNRVAENGLRNPRKRVFAAADFAQSEMYLRYTTSTEEEEEVIDPLLILKQLRPGSPPDDAEAEQQLPLTVIQKQKLLFDLDRALVNVQQLTQVCDAGGVEVMAHYLDEPSGQVRKYAVAVLAQLAINVKGQIAVVTGEVLDRVVGMLKDPMPNVRTKACYCLHRISALFIGCRILVSRGVPAILADIVAADSSEQLIKHRAAATLLQIYRFCPNAPKVPEAPFHALMETPDRQFCLIILQLLDVWGCQIPPINPSPKMVAHLEALSDPDTSTRTAAVGYLLSDLNSDSSLPMELVDSGVLEILLDYEMAMAASERLPQLAYSILTLAADRGSGRRKLFRLGVVGRSLQSLQHATDPTYLFYVGRFMEVLCQHDDGVRHVIQADGIEILVTFVLSHIHEPFLDTLAIPPLSALKRGLLVLRYRDGDEDRMVMLAAMKPLQTIKHTAAASLDGSPEHALQALLVDVLKLMEQPALRESRQDTGRWDMAVASHRHSVMALDYVPP